MEHLTLNVREGSKAVLRAYLPENSAEFSHNGALPAMLVIPGGGYRYCSAREAEPVAFSYLAEGFAAFILTYTTADTDKGETSTFEEPFEDVQAAMDIIYENAENWNIDAKKIACIGFSAGGHLAASLGTMGRRRPAAMVLAYPCILDNLGDILAFDVPSLDEKVDKQTPPAFVFSTFEDSVVPIENSLKFINALNNANIAFESHIYHKGHHGLSLAKDYLLNEDSAKYAHFSTWLPMSARWLKGLW